ncbi:cache domain-containing protein [Psychromonas hadalis]|uniref:cache domain-containing protein n=1 Tax=Psychromonas hadalis TaxID=211669 RepID=UPI0003B3D99E|nr:cache domain-containing protein [Psychromonas hadalis]
MLHKDEIKILRTVKLAPFLVVFFSLISIFILYENNQNRFNNEMDKLKKESILEKETLIKSEVLRVYDFIKAEKSLTTEKIKANIKERVQEAHTIAMAIYRHNQHHSPEEIKQLIADTLRDIRFNKGRGYFFIYESGGTSIMHPISPQLETTNLWNFQDIKGRYVIQELSNIAKKEGEGFLTWWWKKPSDTQTEYEKIGYGKYFAPFDWFIGTGDYIVDYEQELKKELLTVINDIRYGKEGYIFVIDKKGVFLSHVEKSYIGQNRIDYRDANGVATTQKILALAKTGQGFLSYVDSIKPSTGEASHKRSFVKGFDDWQWSLGSGAYLDEIDEIVLRKKARLNEKNNKELLQSAIVTLVTSTVLFFIALIFSKALKKRFQNYQQKVNQKTKALSELNANLEELVSTRTVELESANKDLESTLSHLKSAQKKLLESEKMASMVGLVSGVAHELNTPLGVMVTSISQVEKEVDCLFEKLKSQQLTRKDLQRIEQSWQLGFKLLDTNLQRSVQLVHSFKSLSIHEGDEHLQIFSIKSLLDSLADTFKNQFKRVRVVLLVEVEREITLKSYQWVLSEVLTQLIKNSLMHGFDQLTAPSICISARHLDEWVIIEYFDNGCGSEDVDKIFEPFYTTKRGSDCTGLGLPIVYNQIVHKLLGSIVCSVPKSQGLLFTIKIPANIDVI